MLVTTSAKSIDRKVTFRADLQSSFDDSHETHVSQEFDKKNTDINSEYLSLYQSTKYAYIVHA